MILTCPSCSAKFMISSEALGEEGREVRCGKCAHMWFQPAERDSLDELTDTAEADEESGFDIGLTERAEAHVSEPVKQEEELVSPLIEAPESRLRLIAAGMVALAVVSVLLYGFVALRGPLTNIVPGLNSTYVALGYSLPKRAEPDIAFDRIKLIRSGDAVTGSGFIINLTENPVRLGLIKAELTGPQKDVLETIDIPLQHKELAPESSEKLEFTFKVAPKQAEGVRVYMAR